MKELVGLKKHMIVLSQEVFHQTYFILNNFPILISL
jgi:hypothetical protein